jgi:hypothetical protein
MALSVLSLVGNDYGLYDSEKKRIVMKGTEEDMFNWKHIMEAAVQQVENRRYMDELRRERTLLLVNAGYGQEEATAFLKKQMPYLWM